MIRAPPALANCRARIETPPVPSKSTSWPGFSGAMPPTSPFQAVTPAQGKVAASSKLRLAAIGTVAVSGRTTYSESMPGAGGAPIAGAHPGRAFEPVHEEGRGDAIAGLAHADLVADRDDLAGAAGERHLVRRHLAAEIIAGQHRLVAIVQ